MYNWLIFQTTLLSWKFLLKWYNFFWNFCWNRGFLLCTAISIDFNSQISLLLCEGVGSRKFWKGRKFWKVWVGNRIICKGRRWSRTFYLRLRNPGFYTVVEKVFFFFGLWWNSECIRRTLWSKRKFWYTRSSSWHFKCDSTCFFPIFFTFLEGDSERVLWCLKIFAAKRFVIGELWPEGESICSLLE